MDFFDSDASARQLLETPDVRTQVIQNVSPHAYKPDGSADRFALRTLVFDHPEKRKSLENILHPLIRKQWTARAACAQKNERPYLVDIPLLFETNAEPLFDRIVLVGCSPEIQHQRLLKLRHLEASLAAKILASQWDLGVKIQKSHHIVWNDTDLDNLAAQANLLAAILNRPK